MPAVAIPAVAMPAVAVPAVALLAVTMLMTACTVGNADDDIHCGLLELLLSELLISLYSLKQCSFCM